MRIKTLFACVLTGLFFLQCKKDETSYRVYFYAKDGVEKTTLYLYLDEQLKGVLPYVKTDSVGFTTDSIKAYSLKLNLEAGKYKLDVKNISGSVKSSQKFKISKTKVSAKGTMGGLELISQNNEFLAGVSPAP